MKILAASDDTMSLHLKRFYTDAGFYIRVSRMSGGDKIRWYNDDSIGTPTVLKNRSEEEVKAFLWNAVNEYESKQS